ncbi:MAG: hypothetical protein AAGF28_00955 [Pseudomonadota bacterium]
MTEDALLDAPAPPDFESFNEEAMSASNSANAPEPPTGDGDTQDVASFDSDGTAPPDFEDTSEDGISSASDDTSDGSPPPPDEASDNEEEDSSGGEAGMGDDDPLPPEFDE